MEKDKEVVKACKSMHGRTTETTKRHRVCNVPYSPPLPVIKNTSNKRKKNKTVSTHIQHTI